MVNFAGPNNSDSVSLSLRGENPANGTPVIGLVEDGGSPQMVSC